MKIKLLSQEYLEKAECELYKWFIKNKYKVFFFGFVSFLFYGASRVPYINLFFNKTILLFIVMYLFLSLFVRDVKKVVIFGSLILLLSYPLFLIKENMLTVTFGDFAFGVFFLAVLYKIFEKN